MAPECRIGEDGEFEDPDGCAAEEEGVRLGLGVAYLWMGWSLVFFEVARCFAKRGRNNGSVVGGGGDDGGKDGQEGVDRDVATGGNGTVDYYHSQFQRERSKDDDDEDGVRDKRS